MFRIITILTLLYVLTSSAESNANQRQFIGGTVKKEAKRCFGVQNLQELENGPSKSESPEIVQLTSKNDEPEVDSLTNVPSPDQVVNHAADGDNDMVKPYSKKDNYLRQSNDDVQKASNKNDENNVQGKQNILKNDENTRDKNTLPDAVKQSDLQLNEPLSSKSVTPHNILDASNVVEKHEQSTENNDEYELEPTKNSERNNLDANLSQQNEPNSECQANFQNNRRSNNEQDNDWLDSENVRNQDTVDTEPEEVAPKAPKYDVSQRRNTKFGYYSNPIADPAKGTGVAPMKGGINLWEHNKVCYACTSATNPTCLQPDRRTTVKYCLKGHEACVTKTYQSSKDKGSYIVIRDCGISCDDTDVPGPPYKSCKVCGTDVCNDEPFNGAFSTKSQVFVISSLVVFVIKYTV